jgi:hypothetical protein
VDVNGANDTVRDCLFKVGTNHGALGDTLDTNPSASNFSFLYNEVDGNNIRVTQQAGYTLGFNSSGTLTIQWNHFHNSGGDMVEIQQGNWTQQNIRYNVFANIGYKTGHSDTIQWCRSQIAAGHMDFNLIYQTQAGLSGEGLLVNNSECPGANMRNITIRNNTGISLVNDNFAFGQTITQDAGAATGGHNTTYDNYVDPTGINNFTRSPWFPVGQYASTLGVPSALFNMTDMVTGALIPVPPITAKVGGTWYVYPDGSGYSPSLSSIYSVTPSRATGNVTSTNVITFSVKFNAPMTVVGTPTITLNSGGKASYVSGSGTDTLIYSYTAGFSDSASTLAVTAFNLNGGSLTDDAGNPALLTPLTNIAASFTGLSVNGGVPTPSER